MRMWSRAVLFTAFLLSSLPVAAQSVQGGFIRGTVTDQSGAPVAGAEVAVLPEAGGLVRQARTDAQGVFALWVGDGRYVVSVSSPGFEASEQTLAAGERPHAFVLQVAGFTDSVTVTAKSDYVVDETSTATKTATPLRDVPQSVTLVTGKQIEDQMMLSLGDVVRYVPGAMQHQGENNRDEVVLRGTSSSSSFFVDGVRDDVQYYRDLYNLERVEVIKGPNALIFGRGGGGGVVNRVTKQAFFGNTRSATFETGSFGNKRASGDWNATLGSKVAVRFNGVYENSDSFRDSVGLERYGVSPTVSWTAGRQTTISVGYERFHDRRTADRGISSFQGRPVDVPVETYFGDPGNTAVRADVNLASAVVERRAGAFTIRNHTLFGDYDRAYQNYVPGAVSNDAQQVTITAYNNATGRQNLFNQTDVTYRGDTGRVRHTVLVGGEGGRQLTDNFRNTGFFNNTATSILAPLSDPTISVPVTFRQSATDADNHIETTVGAIYAQDQVTLTDHLQVVGGLRFDRFDLTFHNHRNGTALERIDNLVSPRAAVVVKPMAPVSLYGSYSVSYLPSSGDQFSSLTNVTQQVEPERFTNYEIGAKWETSSGLSVTTAAYRLDRTNTRATDPNDPTRIVQTGSQRTNGFELGVNGRVTAAWTIAGGYALQDAFVTSATTAAPAGAKAGQVPRHTFSLWNRYQVQRRLGVGLGLVHRTEMFATISDTVTLPGYTRGDAAVFWTLAAKTRLQLNVENILDARYFLNADSNTNISPGSPRALRLALLTGF